MGISDSAVYRVFDSFINQYDSIVVIGVFVEQEDNTVDITKVMVNEGVVYAKEI